jgi:stress-induced-phosphoprotein 1
LQEKNKGNAAYKQKDFDEAIAHYNKAVELYDKDISFITNRAAVHFEKKDYDEAIKDCELAVEKGREIRADFKLIAKCACPCALQHGMS